MGVTDDIWHHMCVVWEGESGILAFFKDGVRNYQSYGFRAGSLNVRIEGNGKLNLYYVGGFVRLIFILAVIFEVNSANLVNRQNFSPKA